MERGAAGDSRNECAAKTAKSSGTVLLITLFCAQSSGTGEVLQESA